MLANHKIPRNLIELGCLIRNQLRCKWEKNPKFFLQLTVLAFAVGAKRPRSIHFSICMGTLMVSSAVMGQMRSISGQATSISDQTTWRYRKRSTLILKGSLGEGKWIATSDWQWQGSLMPACFHYTPVQERKIFQLALESEALRWDSQKKNFSFFSSSFYQPVGEIPKEKLVP